MFRGRIWTAVLLAAATGCATHSLNGASASELDTLFPEAQATVEAFFGAPFPETPNFTVAPNRAAFNAAFPAEWGMGETQCWMVGVGVADFLVMLAPEAWAAEACEHDPGDKAHVREILTHELTHTYHGQKNPTRDFTGADDIGWFIEGLAVLVSRDDGKLREQAAEAIAEGAAPAQLEAAWSGKHRYPVAGSLVSYIDETYGRETIIKLLPATTEGEILNTLRVDEATLLQNWRDWAAE